MFCFEILSNFWRKSQKGEIGKSSIFGFLRHSVGCPLRGEAGVPKWHPSGTLQRSGVDIVHREQIFYLCFRTPRVRTPIV